MSATVRLPYARFVRRVSSGASLSKYGYIGMMNQNGEALKSVPWTAAASDSEVTLTTNQLTKTDGVFDSTTGRWTEDPTYTAYMADVYDAFNQAGDAVARNATMCGYAGCVAYRFKLPTSETANALEEVSLELQRDRYLRAGVRISMVLSDSDMPSDDWSVVRGEASGCVRSMSTAPAEGVVGVSSFGFLGQPDAQYLTASMAAADTITFDTSTAFASAASHQYLFVYVTLEDYAGYWNLYKVNEQRQYYIEGSAMMLAGLCNFTFENEIGSPVLNRFDVTFNRYIRRDKPDDACFGFACNSGVSGLSVNDQRGVYYVRDLYAKVYSSLVDPIVGVRNSAGTTQGDTYTDVRSGIALFMKYGIDGARMMAACYILPFSCPVKFDANAVEIKWDAQSLSGGISPGSKISVWINRGSYLPSVSESIIKNPRIYDARASRVGGFELLGVIDADSESGEAVIKMSVPLKSDCATIIMAPWYNADYLNGGDMPITNETVGIVPDSFVWRETNGNVTHIHVEDKPSWSGMMYPDVALLEV